MEIVNSILGKIGEYMLDSTKVLYGYLKHYDDNIVALEHQVAILEEREMDVLKAIQVAKRNGEEIRKSVQHWITTVDGVLVEAKIFLEKNVKVNKKIFKGWFPDMRTLYRLSREAERKLEAIERLWEEQAQFGINVSPSAIDSMTSKDFVPFQTTELAMKEVMDALEEDSINFVGIHGMGGVGKTTLVKQIAIKCKEERLFDNVVMAVVSPTVNIESIQEQISDLLGLKLEERSAIVRASRLWNRLKREKKILVILDDLWAALDLTTIGIPSGEDHKGCKVVITTRRSQVCTAMCRSFQATRIVGLDVLTEQESWDLFKLQVGDIIESSTMRIVAEKVVKECGCLPIALVTVGKAMRGKDLEEWKEAILELEISNPANIEDMDAKVFNCIKFSYDYLRDEEAKACFLLCCLFPEDYDIDIEKLVRYGVGLNTFKGINKIQEARRRAHLITNHLKASSLLLASEYEGYIKMHDVVRDVAKAIALDRYFVKAGEGLKEWPNELTMDGYNGIGGISLMTNEIRKYPDVLECPDLEIFLMQDNPVEQEMPEEVFRGMKKLRVLDQSPNKSETRRLEPSFSHLTNLRTLIIDGTSMWSRLSIWGISSLGELKMLQVVSLRFCKFEEPLDALRKIKNLRWLDLAFSVNCSSLFNFAEDCIFPQLEELCLTEPMSYSVAELMKFYPGLNVLKFCTDDICQIPQNFGFPHLDRFSIFVGKYVLNYNPEYVLVQEYLKNILYLDGEYGGLDDAALPNRIGTLLQSVSIMSLRHLNGFGNILPYLMVEKDSLAVLEELNVERCDKLEYLFDLNEKVKDAVEEEKGILANLTQLHLIGLGNLEELWKGHIGLVHLRNLKTVWIEGCPKLQVIFPWSVAQRLEQLQELSVMDCDELEEIVERETEEEAIHKVVFPQLQYVCLENLPKLVGFYTGNLPGSQSTPNLKMVNMILLGNKKEIPLDGTNLDTVIKNHTGPLGENLEEIVESKKGKEAVHMGLSPTELEYLRNLKRVNIESNKLKVLFVWSVAQGLDQMQELSVSRCYELEEIFGRETGEKVGNKDSARLMPFCNLKTVKIMSCHKLKVVFHQSVAQRLEQLQELSVEACRELKEIIGRETGQEAVHEGSSMLVPFCNLKTVEIRSCPKLKVLFHWSIAQGLEQLQELSVWYCKELEEIVGSETKEEAFHKGSSSLVPFRKFVRCCEGLKEIGGSETGEEAVHKLVFGELRYLDMKVLPKLNGFCTDYLPGSESTPKLKFLRMGEADVEIDGKNLDAVIKENKGRLLLKRKKEKS